MLHLEGRSWVHLKYLKLRHGKNELHELPQCVESKLE